MFNPETASSSFESKPFLIYIRHRDKVRDVTWRPDAFVGLSRGLRTSGLLAALPAEELKTLLYLLSFVTANGNVTPSVLQLAEAFHLSQAKTHRRMERLVQMTWANEPLVHYRRFESGLDAFVPQAGLFALEEEANAPEMPNAAPYRAVPREAVIAHSRQRYSRPRAEVEAIVASQLRPLDQPLTQPPQGRQLPPPSTMDKLTAEQQEAMRQLQHWGVNIEQAASLLARFDVARILRQVNWLPARRVKSPTGFLIAAIERDYEAPRGLPRSDVTQGTSEDGLSVNPAP